MSEQLDTPAWRRPPRRFGPVESNLDTPPWLELLERVAPAGCVAVCIFALSIAAWVWGVDWLAGHL